MSSVKFNTDKMEDDLFPTIRTTKTKIQEARTSAGNVNFPKGDYGWSDIKSHLSDYCEDTEKYYNWIKELKRKFSSSVSNNVESINSVKIEKVQIQNIIVK